MTDTTTISITEAQRDELAALKKHDRESYKAVIDRLLDGGGSGAPDSAKVDSAAVAAQIVEQIGRENLSGGVPDTVSLEASERRAIAQEVAEVLR